MEHPTPVSDTLNPNLEPLAAGRVDVVPVPEAQQPDFRRCSATTKAGKRCPNPVMGESDVCMTHAGDEAVQAMVKAANAQGGSAPRVRFGLPTDVVESINLRTLDGRNAVLEATVRALAVGAVSGTTATAIVNAIKAVAEGIRLDLEELAQKQAREIARLREMLERRR